MKPITTLWFIVLLLVSTAIFAHNSRDYTVFNNTIRIDAPQQQRDLRQQQSWQAFEQRNGHWYADFDVYTKSPIRAAGKAVTITTAGDAVDAALQFVQDELSDFNIPVQELQFHNVHTTNRYSYITFRQYHQGLEIDNARITLRLPQPNQVAAFTANVHPVIDINTTPTIQQSNLVELGATTVPGVFTHIEDVELKILPIPTAQGYDYKLVYAFILMGKDDGGIPAQYYTMLDAHNATLYYQYNKVHQVGPAALQDVAVDGRVYDNPNFSSEIRNLANMRVELGGNAYTTNADGYINYTPPSSFPVLQYGTAYLEGPFAEVHIGDFSIPVPGYDITLVPGDELINLPNSASTTAIAGFYHTNRIHDYMKSWIPNFTYMDLPMRVRVDVSGEGDCNAYYDGTLNFLAESGSCWSTSTFADICYHEYGHGITYDYYSFLGASWNNGALGEGYADVWALGVTQNPILSQGFFKGNINSSIRRYDIDPKVYPEDLVGQVHADGEIICGAWWDLGQEIGMDNMFQVFIDTWLATPMRPNGQEGVLYSDILFEALLADDDNGDLTDGTPNSAAIIDNFALHGILLQISGAIGHTEMVTAPADLITSIDFTLEIDFSYTAFLDGVGVWYRTSKDAPYTFTNGLPNSGNNYYALIPAQPVGTVVDYYIELQDNLGGVALATPYLANQVANPNIPFVYLVGYDEKLYDDFSGSASAWSTSESGDDASTGQWTIGSPTATYINDFLVQPDTDSSPTSDNVCAYTGSSGFGAGAGDNDVDDGRTTLTSPGINVMQYEDPAISYMRWYSNDKGANPGNDNFEVYISNNGSDWVQIEDANVADGWRKYAFKVFDYVEASTNIQVRFVASDNLVPGLEYDGGSLVEAAIDDIKVYDLATDVGIVGVDVLQNIQVYPNPANESINIEASVMLDEMVNISLYTLTGQEVFTKNNVNLNNQSLAINTQDFSSGVYFLEMRNEKHTYQQKVLIKH